MLWLFILLGVLVIFAALLIVLYHIAFYVKPKRLTVPLSMPPASLEKRMKDSDMKYTLGLVREIIELPHEKVFLRSFDGLKLAGRYYATATAACPQPISGAFSSRCVRSGLIFFLSPNARIGRAKAARSPSA